MSKKDKNTLGYLGQPFQLRLIGQLLTDVRFADSVIDMIKPEYFDDVQLRCIVMHLKNNHEEYDTVPDYVGTEIILKKEMSGHQLEHCLALLKESKEYGLNNSLQIQDTAKNFFKQQEVIKASREVLKIAEKGNVDNYHLCEDILKHALESGSDKDDISDVFEGIDDVLSDDFREPVPTGIEGLDVIMGGGLGKSELGIILAPFGVGKAQPLKSKVLTPNGWKTMGNINIGEQVISRTGKPTKVTGVFPQGKRPIYKVKFSDKTETLCDEEHLWSVKDVNSINSEYQTLTTIDILNSKKDFKIRYVEPVEFNKRELTLDPYLLGRLLMSNNILTNDIISNIIRETYGVFDVDSNFLISELINSIKTLGLDRLNVNELFIQDDFIYSSVTDRVNLLQGLVDSSLREYTNIITLEVESKLLSKQIRELVLSLGGFCEIVVYKSKYVIKFNFQSTIKFRPSRHFNNLIELSDNEKIISSIEYYGEEEAKCIMVDDFEHLYVTDDYIVTHNTTFITKLANTAKNHGKNVLQIFFEDQPKVIKRKHYSCWTGINLSELQERREEVKTIVKQRESEPGEIRLKKFPSHGTTIPVIRQYIRKLISQGFRPDILLLDYIDCIVPSSRIDDNNVAEGQIMRQFESLLDEFQLVGWTAIQGNRCVWVEEKVDIKDKGNIRIGDVKEGDEILTHKGYKKITTVFPTQKQSVYKIKLKSGKEIKVSSKHEFPTDSGKLKSILTGLSIGDKLLTKKEIVI